MNLHTLMAAMHADGLIAFYVTAACVVAVYVLYNFAQVAWSYLEPLAFALCYRMTDWRQRVIRRKERSRAAITDRELQTSMARAIDARDRRLLSERLAADVAERRRAAVIAKCRENNHQVSYPATACDCGHTQITWTGGIAGTTTMTLSARDAFYFPAESQAREKPEVLDRNSDEYARGTVLSLVPKGSDAA